MRVISALLLTALVVGCGVDDSAGPAESTVASSPTTASTTPPPTTLPSSMAPSVTVPPVMSTASPPAVLSECKAADLTVSLGDSEGTAGTMYRALVFTNTGGRTCTIQGFPGVSFVAGDDGHQVSEAAVWIGEKGPVVALKPSMTATAPLGFVNIGVFDPETCQPTPVRGLRVYPPHDTASEFVPFETTACAGTPPSNHLKVGTVHEGSGLS
jgi:hypothetical protein